MLNPAFNHKKSNSSALYTTAILLMLIAVVSIALLCAYKWILSQKSLITPQEMEIKRLSKIVETLPNDPNSRLALAYSYQKNGQYTIAVKLYTDVLKIDENNLACLYNLAMIDINQKNPKEAELKLNKVLSLKNSHVLAALALGELYINQKKYEDAIKTLDMAIKVKPQLINPRLLKGKALEEKGNKAAAIDEYKQVLKYIPDHPEALSSLNKLKQ